jgi:hypothetical protein
MRFTIFVLLLTLACSANSQNDSIRLGAKFGSYNEEMTELYQMTNMEVYQFHLSLAEVKNKKVKFSYVEYKDSAFSPEKPIGSGLDMKNPRGNFENDSIYTFKIAALKPKEDRVDMWFRFPLFGLGRPRFNTLSNVSDRYSLRDFITTTGSSHSYIPVGKKVPFLVYSLPYEKDGMLYYCSITTDGIQPEKWARTYGIKHYIIFYIKIEE